MLLLDGKLVRDSNIGTLRKRIKTLGFVPKLAIVQIGAFERSRAYVGAKQRFAATIGAEVELIGLPSNVFTEDAIAEVERLNEDVTVNGIIVQLPLPKGINQRKVIETIDPRKDVDGLTSRNLKALLENDQSGFVPATAKGVLSLLSYYGVEVESKRVVVVGRSLLAGKTIALACLNNNATVTVCHRFTRTLPEITRTAEILIVATGHPGLIGREHVSPGQIVVDVGISLSTGEQVAEEITLSKLVGDVDFEAVRGVVSALSPVPGGVGPMTVLSLFENLLLATERQMRLP